MLKKNNKATPSSIKFKPITKILRTIPNGYSTTNRIQSNNDCSLIISALSSRSNYTQLNPNKFISSIKKYKKDLSNDFSQFESKLYNNTISDEFFHLKTESNFLPISIQDECDSIQNICLTEQSESIKQICFTEQCDYQNENNMSILDTPTKIHQKDMLNGSDSLYNINILNLEKATKKLTDIIEKKKKRRRSYNKTNIDLAANKLANIIDRKQNGRRTCSGKPQQKLNKYIEIFQEEKKLTQLQKLENIINKERKSGVPTSTPSPCPSFKEHIICNKYFIHNDNDYNIDNDEVKMKQMSSSYMMSFKNWKICGEKDLLPSKVIDHLAYLSIKEEVIIEEQINHNHYSSNVIQRGIKNDISQWARKDISSEITKAEQYKNNLITAMTNDTVKSDLTALLNALTVDNYELIISDILSIISIKTINQEKYIEVILRKAITEKAYVKLYAKLCKDLDHLLSASSTSKSTMRVKLIESCKNIFDLDLYSITPSNDSLKQEQYIKRYIIGNINFIGELINSKIISKKVGLYCIESLFKKCRHSNQSKAIHLIQIEALISFLDIFGTIIYNRFKTIPNNKTNEISIHNYISQLIQLNENDFSLPGYIKYKIINLEEKEKNNWEETLFEKSIRAKGKKEMIKEFVMQNKTEEGAFQNSSQCYEQNNNDKIRNKDIENNDTLQQLINIKIKANLKDWMSHLNEGNKLKDFNWKEIDSLVNKNIPIKNIFIAYVESTIDTVINDTTYHQANKFFQVILQYYFTVFNESEIKELKTIAIDLLSTIGDMELDNKYIPKIWGCIIYYLLKNKIVVMKDFNSFLPLHKDTIK